MSDQNPDQDQVENEASPELATEDASVADAQDAPEGEQPADEMSLLQEQLEAAEAAAGMARDELLRVQAEMQNLRRRTEQDIEKAHKFGQEKFSTELLAVMDNLERSAAAAEASEDEAVQAIKEGVELTLKGFMDCFKRFNIEAVDPLGEPFDPQLHQAMSIQESPDAEPNSVIAVMQKGYTLHGRVIRPAMVMVSK
ncbi:MAG TPA: nucleotide exchange factor GrpE [Gammaproteobacteria bacterium]|jgi:molecular chaperone GrpE|uniref:Protein GrpE n=4 Tax=OM182 clade TaxID=745002 RepID=A0A0R2S6I2_9GAMM|nr:MAG: molecular chaperone GrpE [OM182 bacterium BACL3 MAG-120507-bin80]KRO79353.1 MAG: molecular chaperone GrpE [OM182 bacterium BACL3 MAG-120619-bin3]KRP25790.1 MAG: molecular chaperone GrpE [OM182 bacterium BACL3 MAG-120924-bin41]KRP35888.1 MAG: molecular chaperone GrpE [OM182 bacterium BACL3 MAG-120531-bin86]MBT4782128.1 nucleotide exchange factor GrpE [Gammaproteobacteria bacterium]MDP5073785.1 nucleotide exchange factor GrpE [OM182 bacterium]